MNDGDATDPPSSVTPQPDGPPDGKSASALQTVEAKLATVLNDVPVSEPQKQQIIHKIEETFMAAIATNVQNAPRLDPETVKIIAVTVEKDNDNKFKYLTQKQANDAAKQLRDHEFAVVCHTDNVRLFRPVLISAMLVFVGCVTAGIYFIAIGREAVGSGILSGVFGAAFGYLGGLGTANYFKPSRPVLRP
jgi:hypothetical protein